MVMVQQPFSAPPEGAGADSSLLLRTSSDTKLLLHQQYYHMIIGTASDHAIGPARDGDGRERSPNVPMGASMSRNTASTSDQSVEAEQLGAEDVKCECCGLQEECTKAYADRVRGAFCSHFVCGLCAEAVIEEQRRMSKLHGSSKNTLRSVPNSQFYENDNSLVCSVKASHNNTIVEEAALQRHMSACLQFNCSMRAATALHTASAAAALGQLFLRRIRSNNSKGPTSGGIIRSSSCQLPAGNLYFYGKDN